MPAYAGAAIALVIPGTTSNGDTGSGERLRFLPTATEDERITALEAHDTPPGLPVLHQERVDGVLVHLDVAGRLADGDPLGARRREVEQRRVRQPVVHDDVGGREHLGAAPGQQPGIAGPRADEPHASPVDPAVTPAPRSRGAGSPRASGPSPPDPPPTSTVRLIRRPSSDAMRPSIDDARAALVGPSTSVRTTCACAPTGSEHPPPSSARNARSAVTARCASASSIAIEELARHVVVRAALDRERALRDLRKHVRERQALRDPIGELETIERGGRDDDRVEARGLVEPRLDVAPQLREPEVGSQRRELRAAPHRAGRDHTTGRELAERGADERVARVGALGHRREQQAVGCLRREILRGVHRDVGATVEDRLLDLLHEHADPTHAVHRLVGSLVTGRLHDHELGIVLEQLARPARPASAPARSHGWRRAADRSRSAGGPRTGRLVEAEQRGERVGVQLAASGSGGVLEPDGRLVEELVHEPAGRLLDELAAAGLQRVEPGREPLELDEAELLGPFSERRDDGCDLACERARRGSGRARR